MYAIRFGHPADLPWLEQVTIQAAWESLSPEERRSAVPADVAHIASMQLRGLLSSPQATVLTATAHHWPVGCILASVGQDATTNEPNGHLVFVWVDPAHRGRGLGRVLLARAEGIFRQLAIRKVKLVSGLHNQAAVRLAERAGYKPEGLIGTKPL